MDGKEPQQLPTVRLGTGGLLKKGTAEFLIRFAAVENPAGPGHVWIDFPVVRQGRLDVEGAEVDTLPDSWTFQNVPNLCIPTVNFLSRHANSGSL